MKRMLTLWRARPWLTSAFVLACLLTLFFAGRLTVYTIYWATHQDQPILPWMTVGYVARSWGLEPRALDSEAGLPMPEVLGRPQSLEEIARDRNVPVSEVIADLQAAIERMRAAEPKE
jgi:hypothetical protein